MTNTLLVKIDDECWVNIDEIVGVCVRQQAGGGGAWGVIVDLKGDGVGARGGYVGRKFPTAIQAQMAADALAQDINAAALRASEIDQAKTNINRMVNAAIAAARQRKEQEAAQ